jgi:transcriptional regulator with XRE-family HTH domain
MSKQFAEKLTVVMKVLSLTRADLAAELGVDKSIVGRWATGRVTPSSHNLTRLTELVARRVGEFRLIDWERDKAGLENLLGAPVAAQSAGRASRLPPGLPLPLMDHILDSTALRASAYEGYFRSTRPYAQRPGHFIHDQIMIRMDECGLLRLYMGTGGVRLHGWVMPLQGKLFVVASEMTSGVLGFAILNGVNTTRAGVIDGILLNCALDNSHSPTACAIVVERTGELCGDREADDLCFTDLVARDPLAPEGAVPAEIAAHLVRDIGPAQLAVGGDWLLSLPLMRSMARGNIGA